MINLKVLSNSPQKLTRNANRRFREMINSSISEFTCLLTANNLHLFFQLQRFRSLEDSDGETLSHNFRPIQPIGDRVVWYTSDTLDHDDDELHDKIHGEKKKKKKKFYQKKRKNGAGGLLMDNTLTLLAFSLLWVHSIGLTLPMPFLP